MCKLDRLDEALPVVDFVDKQGKATPQNTIYSLLQGCAKKKDLAAGRRLHSLMVSHGLDTVASLGNHLIQLFTSYGSLREANLVFENIAKPSLFTWYAIISAHVFLQKSDRALELYKKMQQEGVKPNKLIFACTLKACGNIGSLLQGKLIHDQIRKSGFESDVVVGSTLVDMYAKCGSLKEARKVFNDLPRRNVVSWGAMIAGYAQHGHGLPALELFHKMQDDGIKPNKVILLCSLKACGSIGALKQGRLIHDRILNSGFDTDAAIGNSLVDMYAKCNDLEEAHRMFDGLPNQSVVSWNALIVGYAQHRHGLTALELYDRMQEEHILPSKVTYSCILKVCGIIGSTEQGKLIHDQIVRSGFQSDVGVGNALVDMYGKCGSLEEARKVFDCLPNQDIVSWGAMVAGYAQHGNGLLALEVFEQMQSKGIKPNKVTILCTLKACVNIRAIEQGKMIHDQLIRNELESDIVIGSGLIDLYSKCGSLEEAYNMFEKLPFQDTVSWGTMIGACAQHGHGLRAIELFEQMQQEGVQPDEVTFSCTLKGCGIIGAIGHGKLIHSEIINSGLESNVIVGSTLVDMYAKCGNLEEAVQVFKELPKRNVVSWCAMITGYVQHGHYGPALQCLEDLENQGLKLDGNVYTGILAALSHTGQVEEGHNYFRSMREEHGITPCMEHFNCMVDLLGRAGLLSEAEDIIKKMPMAPDSMIWISLLGACRKSGNVNLGERCFEQVVCVDPDNAVSYVLMSNIYADAHMWEEVQQIQEQRKYAYAWKKPGKAWMEVSNKVHEFIVGDKTHSHSGLINAKLKRLGMLMKQEGYVPQLDIIFDCI